MKKKPNYQDRIKQAMSMNKGKRSKLGDITNQGFDSYKKKKQESQSKSTKSVQKINFCTLDTSKQNKSKNSSMIIQPRYGSSADNTKCIQPINQTFELQMRGPTLFDSIVKGKLSTIQQQNKYLSSMNTQLKSQLAKTHEEIILLNKSQGTLREQNQKLNRKLDEDLDKFKNKELQLTSKIKELKRQIERNQQTSQDLNKKFEGQNQNLLLQKNRIQIQLNNLKQDYSELKNKIKIDEVDKSKEKENLILQIQQEKGKCLDMKNILQKGLNQISSKLMSLILNQDQKEIQNHIRNIDNSFNNFSSVSNLITEVQEQISRLTKQNKMLLLNFQELNHSQQNYNQKLAVFLKQISIFRSQNQRLKKALLDSQQSKQTIQAQADVYKTSALQKKLNETKNSLQYWKRKYDQCKMQNIKHQKEIETLKQQTKNIQNSFKKLQAEIERKNEKLQIYKSNQNNLTQKSYIEDLKNQIQKLRHQKFQIFEESKVIAEKLHSFKQKVIILESKLKQNKNNRQNLLHMRQNSNNSFIMQQFNTVTSYDNSNINGSEYLTENNRKHKQIQGSNSKKLQQYRGDMQSRLQQQFRSTRTLSVSPEKAKGISLIKQSII